MQPPDISTIYNLDLDMLRKAEHYRQNNLIYVRVGNSDGVPLYVALADDPNEVDTFAHDEALSVAKNILTEIISYVVPPAKVLNLDNILVGGSNIAKFIVTFNGANNKIVRTYYGSALSENISYNSFRLAAGTIIKIEVIHQNDLGHNGDFEATIEGKLKDA